MQDHAQHIAGDTWKSWIPLVLICVLGLAYLCAATLHAKRKASGMSLRTASFLIGILMVSGAVHPEMMRSAHNDLRMHMVQHLLLAMFGPIFLVFGAPLTVVLQALPVKLARAGTAILRTGFFHFLSHPLTALCLNTGGMFLLYLTPLYRESLNSPALHYVIHIHFLAAGYLFTLSMIGIDTVPRRRDHRLKIIVLFLSISLHAFLGKFMYAYLYPLDTPHTGSEIREAAKLMYYWGDLSEFILVVIVFYNWYNGIAAARRRSGAYGAKLPVA